jgi:hypothetical protein
MIFRVGGTDYLRRCAGHGRRLMMDQAVEAAHRRRQEVDDELDLEGLEALTGADIEFCVREASAPGETGVAILLYEYDLEFTRRSRRSERRRAPGAARSRRARLRRGATAVQGFLTGSD